MQLWHKRNTQQIETLGAYLYSAVRFAVFNTIRKGKIRENLFIEVEKLFANNDADANLLRFDFNRKLDESIAELQMFIRTDFGGKGKIRLWYKRTSC